MITVEQVTKKYGRRTALEEVSFEIGQAEIVGLVGVNGAGKSTLMNILTGALAPTSGRVWIDGVENMAAATKQRNKIGYLPENPPLYPEMRVNEYLKFVCQLKRVSIRHRQEIQRVVEQTGIESIYRRRIGNLSKGYRQRVGLAQALLGNPSIIVLDEPAVGLDPTQIIELKQLIKSLAGQATILFSSHILEQVQAVCQRIMLLDQGRIVTTEFNDSAKTPLQLQMAIKGPMPEVLNLLRQQPFVQSAEPMADRFDSKIGQIADIGRYLVQIDKQQQSYEQLFYCLARSQYPIFELKQEQTTLEQQFINQVTSR